MKKERAKVLQKISGYYTPGTFQQYVLGPANYVTPIPEGLDSAAAAPMLCAGVTVYSALRKTNAEAGNWVVLLGAGGGLGHLAVQFSARGIGHRVIGIDHSSKKDVVLDSGAEHFIPVDGTDDLAAAVKQDIETARRRTSSGSRRILSGEKKVFMHPDDKIFEDPQEEATPPKKQQPQVHSWP